MRTFSAAAHDQQHPEGGERQQGELDRTGEVGDGKHQAVKQRCGVGVQGEEPGHVPPKALALPHVLGALTKEEQDEGQAAFVQQASEGAHVPAG